MTNDLNKPNPARMYDYFLGGDHNFPSDRAAAEQIIAMYPHAALTARANRAFLRRAVTFLAEQGIDQFLDIGSGIPTANNVHEVAQRINPNARVVYVDVDPVAVVYGQSILQRSANVVTIEGDVRHPDEILSHSETRRLIDFNRPVAVLLVAMLQFVTLEGEAQRAVRQLWEPMPLGSYLVISHATKEYVSPDVIVQGEAIYARSTNPGKLRSREQISRFFQGLTLCEPGLVLVPLWRPDGSDDLLLNNPEQSMFLAGVAQKS